MSKFILLSKDQYFEAKIQLRPFNQEVFDYVMDQIDKRKGVFVSKIEELKTGVDIYMSSQQFARRLGKMLKDKFKGDLKITRTLHTQDKMTSKLVYRGTILFRLKEIEE
ncbi:MAG: NMD3-related protein [archaeon]